MSEPLRIAILGAGARGEAYARLLTERGVRVAAIADPDPQHRNAVAAEHNLAADQIFTSWEEFVSVPRPIDAVVIATPDRLHRGPAVVCAKLGYDILIEKPIAPTEEDAKAVVDAAEEAGVLMMVCHVLRYTDYTQEIRRIVKSGEIGDIASVEHLEPIGWWHFAHSYVRGNWCRAEDSSPMLLAKSSHDIDWLSYIIDRPVEKVSSFGSLMEFTPAHKPQGATDRCLDCPVSATCPYSAVTIYSRCLGDPVYEKWPLGVVTPDPTPEALHEALRVGPYGRCVYAGYNDVIDHQVVGLQYAGGATASFTVTAFTQLDFRQTRIFGTRGSVKGNGTSLRILDFLSGTSRAVDFDITGSASAADGHGGADGQLATAFVKALSASPEEKKALSNGRESLYSHSIVWAAERARLTGTVVTME